MFLFLANRALVKNWLNRGLQSERNVIRTVSSPMPLLLKVLMMPMMIMETEFTETKTKTETDYCSFTSISPVSARYCVKCPSLFA